MQKKKKGSAWYRILALVLAGVLVLGALLSAILSMAFAEEEQTTYRISAIMLTDEQVIRCEQTTVYHNNTDGKLSQLFFACYPNALRRMDSAPFDDADFATVYPSGFAPGGIQFASVTVNGEVANWGVLGQDESFLRVDVDLEAGDRVQIDMAYDLLLPICSGFAGAGLFDWRLTHAFPTLCPYENGTFQRNGALSTGNFAFADASDWEMELTAPKGWQVIGSGEESTREEGDAITWSMHAQNARDMAVVIGRRYTQYTSDADERIRAFCNDRSAAQAALKTAQQALALYEGWFGAYPYPQLDLVMSQYAWEAESAPGVVLLNRTLFSLAQRKEMEYWIAQKVAQQFFGEIVGVDPYTEPWLSESVSGLCAMLYYRAMYGEERFLAEMRSRVQPALLVTIPGGAAADSSAAYFRSRSEYDLMLNGRGVAALYELTRAMGEDDLLKSLRQFFLQNAFAQADGQGFVAACNAVSGTNWGNFLWDMLANIGTDANQTEWY